MSIVNYIELQDAAGVPKGSPITGDIELAGAGRMSVDATDVNEVEISAGIITGDDPFYAQKYKDIVNGVALGPDYGPFSGMPYWISAINQAPGLDNFIYLLAGACSQLGLFPDEHPDGAAHTLALFDMCVADVDCQDYDDLYQYMELVRQALINQKNNIESPPGVDAANGYGVFDQYIAVVSYWNYLVQLLAGGSQVYQDDEGNYIIRFIYQHFGNDIPQGADPYPELQYSILDGVTPIVPASTENIFRPTTHEVVVTSAANTETLTGIIVSNTQWVTDVFLPPLAPGVVVDYVGDWVNTETLPNVTGSFTVE